MFKTLVFGRNFSIIFSQFSPEGTGNKATDRESCSTVAAVAAATATAAYDQRPRGDRVGDRRHGIALFHFRDGAGQSRSEIRRWYVRSWFRITVFQIATLEHQIGVLMFRCIKVLTTVIPKTVKGGFR